MHARATMSIIPALLSMGTFAIELELAVPAQQTTTQPAQTTNHPQPQTIPGTHQPEPALKPGEQSLFDRIGGTYPMAAIADDFVKRMSQDPTVMRNPSVARGLTPDEIPGLRFEITAQLIDAAGGPYHYRGEGMHQAHENLNITPEQWNAGIDNFKAAMQQHNIPQMQQDELLAIVERMRPAILGHNRNLATPESQPSGGSDGQSGGGREGK